jgi:fidgetin-like protein 1
MKAYLNRPQELDSAARRRFVKRIYIPLPDLLARQAIITNLLQDQKHTLLNNDIEHICTLTDGFSGADMHSLCHDAALGPIRDIHDIELLSSDEVRIWSASIDDWHDVIEYCYCLGAWNISRWFP